MSTDDRNEKLPREAVCEDRRRAIVLSGGGARGAYEVGVLCYLFQELPAKLGFVPRFDIFAGSSVGAVHCCFLAAHAQRPDAGVEQLVRLWRHMSFTSVYRFALADAYNFSRTILGSLFGRSASASGSSARPHGLLNTKPLEQLVVRDIPWKQLRRNLRSKVLDSLCVSATEVSTGRTVSFVDNRERTVPAWTRDEMLIARPTRIGPDHALASASIPFLFPAVRIGETYYCDGSLRLHSPLASVLRLRANRVLSIGLRRAAVSPPERERQMTRAMRFESPGFMFGKILNAFLIDRLDHDVFQMRLMNRMIRAGMELAGEAYLDRLAQGLPPDRSRGLCVVEDCFIRPSQDIGAIAAEHVRRIRKRPSRTWIGNLAFRTLTRDEPEGESDLMSYLLFDGEYASSLIALGWSDAARIEDELIRFFNT